MKEATHWPPATIESIQAPVKYALNGGPFGSNLVSRMYVSEGVPVIRGTNLPFDKRFNFGGLVFVTEDTAKRLSANTARPGDVIFTQRGTLGQVGLIPISSPYKSFIISQSQMKLTVATDKADASFIYYTFRSPEIVERITALTSSSGVPHINLDTLRKFEIPLPPLPTQRRIASVLSAYDDLIENNARRIAVLEEMARRLYEEWFVQFWFPGHEEAKFVESELGRVPASWRVQTVAETFRITGGGTPSKAVEEYWSDGDINWYSPTDLTRAGTMFMDQSGTKITGLGLKKSSAQLFAPYSVMMTSRATIGAIAINTTEACTNQGFITCFPNDQFPLYLLFHWLRNNVDMFISLGTGATFKEITKGTFKTILLAVPPQALAQRFEHHVQPMMELALRLQRKNANLRAQRDLLLPKLISGEIDVTSQNCVIVGA